MPDDRFLHPRLGHSEKVNLLTDLEFRVWIQYLLSADDFGVMRLSAVAVQADNDALHAKPTRSVQRCLDRLVDVGLLVTFQHQQRHYVCQLDWHAYQKVKNARATINPAPPVDLLLRCETGTFALFRDQHPHCPDVTLDATSEAASEGASDVPHEAPLITAMANGSRLEAHGLRERFSEFWRHYPRKVGKEAAWNAWQKAKPSSELLATMLTTLLWQCRLPDWQKDGGQFIPHPSTWLNQHRWLDEPVEVTPSASADPTNKRIAGLMAGGEAFLARRRS